MIAERSLAQAAHAWGVQGIPFNDEPKSELFHTPLHGARHGAS